MPDVNAPKAREVIGAPISALALGKLGTMRAGPNLLSTDMSLGDAFAEVFAAISQAESFKVTRLDTHLPSESSSTSNTEQSSEVAQTAEYDWAADQDDFSSAQQHQLSENPDDPQALQAEVDLAHGVAETETQAGISTAPESESSSASDNSGLIDDGFPQDSIGELAADSGSESKGGEEPNRKRRGRTAVELNQQVQNPMGQAGITGSRSIGDDKPVVASTTVDTETQVLGEQSEEESGRAHRLRIDSESVGNDASEDHRNQQRHRSSVQDANLAEAKASKWSSRVGSISNESALTGQLEAFAGRVENAASAAGSAKPTVDHHATIAPVSGAGSTNSNMKTDSGSGAIHRNFGPTNGLNSRSQSGLASTGESGKSNKPASDVVARIKLIHRVSKAFQHLGSEGGSIRIRLAPADLGSVRVEMQVQNSRVKARVVAETEETSNALKSNLPELRARLETYGMRVEQLDVEVETFEHGFDTRQDAESRRQWSEHQRSPGGSFTSGSEKAARVGLDAEQSEVESPPMAGNPAVIRKGVDLRL